MEEMPDRIDDEIELIDHLRVIWKWKYLILVGTVVCALVSAVISINKPKIYRVETILQPRVVIVKTGRMVYFDSPNNIRALVEAETYNQNVVARLKNPIIKNLPVSFDFKVDLPVNTNLIKISYETAQADDGVSILNKLIESLSEESKDEIEYFQNRYALEIREKKAEVLRLQDELRLSQIDINNIN